ncbi:MAG: GGDEF domain-containing protein [Fusobacteriota bacterium]
MKNKKSIKNLLGNLEYENNPEIIKFLLDYIGEEGHNKIQKNLFKKLIKDYVKLNNKLEKQLEKITRLSETDHLTGIYNRIKFTNEMKRELERYNRYGNKLCLIMFDIDHFKKFNDKYGHDIGDLVLKEVTKSVSKEIRQTDTFARWGGEEFMVLAPETDLEAGKVFAEKLRKKIEDIKFKSHDIGEVTCSFGVTQINKEDNMDTFTKRVDEALYLSKENGRNKTTAK